LRGDDLADRLRVDEPAAVRPQAEVGEVSPGGLEHDAPPVLHLEPVGALLEVVERRLDRLQLDEEGRLGRVPLRRGAGGELRVAGALLGREGDDLVLAAIEEDVEAAVGLAGDALCLARAGDAIDELEGGALRARDGDRVAPERGDGEDRLLATARRDDRMAQHRLGRRRRRRGDRRREDEGERQATSSRRPPAPRPHPGPLIYRTPPRRPRATLPAGSRWG